MSSIASFYLIDTCKLPELIENARIQTRKTMFGKTITDNYWQYLGTNATALDDFRGSGHVYGKLFIFLEEEKNIDLFKTDYDTVAQELTDKRGCSQFILTHTQKTELADKLDPSLYSLQEIQQFNEEFSGEGDEETAQQTLDGLKLLKDHLMKIPDDSKILLLIAG